MFIEIGALSRNNSTVLCSLNTVDCGSVPRPADIDRILLQDIHDAEAQEPSQ